MGLLDDFLNYVGINNQRRRSWGGGLSNGGGASRTWSTTKKPAKSIPSKSFVTPIVNLRKNIIDQVNKQKSILQSKPLGKPYLPKPQVKSYQPKPLQPKPKRIDVGEILAPEIFETDINNLRGPEVSNRQVSTSAPSLVDPIPRHVDIINKQANNINWQTHTVQQPQILVDTKTVYPDFSIHKNGGILNNMNYNFYKDGGILKYLFSYSKGGDFKKGKSGDYELSEAVVTANRPINFGQLYMGRDDGSDLRDTLRQEAFQKGPSGDYELSQAMVTPRRIDVSSLNNSPDPASYRSYSGALPSVDDLAYIYNRDNNMTNRYYLQVADKMSNGEQLSRFGKRRLNRMINHYNTYNQGADIISPVNYYN